LLRSPAKTLATCCSPKRAKRANAPDTAGDAGDLLARGRQIVAEAKARIDGAVAEGKDAASRQRSTLENDSNESAS